MQSWASEINLSEASFLTKKGQAAGGDGEPPQQEHVYALRWFTPAVEVDVRFGVCVCCVYQH
jgi:predicted PhzF superfamily epimerase YddE/YHI9